MGHNFDQFITGQNRVIRFDNIYNTVAADVHDTLTGSEFFGNFPAGDIGMRPGRAIFSSAALHNFPTRHVFYRCHVTPCSGHVVITDAGVLPALATPQFRRIVIEYVQYNYLMLSVEQSRQNEPRCGLVRALDFHFTSAADFDLQASCVFFLYLAPTNLIK